MNSGSAMLGPNAALVPEPVRDAPTSAIYRLTLAAETRPDSAADSSLFFGSSSDVPGYTETTLRRSGRFGAVGQALTIGTVVGAGLGLLSPPTIFEPTPFSINPAHVAPFEPAPILPSEEPAAYRAFKDLGVWLDAEDGQVAEMVGIGRTTPYTWHREGREPRAATAQRIYEHHATLDSLNRRLGPEGLRRWLHEGVPTRRDALLSGGLPALDADVHDVLFRSAPSRRVDLAAAPEDVSPAVSAATGASPARASGRRPRRPAQ